MTAFDWWVLGFGVYVAQSPITAFLLARWIKKGTRDAH